MSETTPCQTNRGKLWWSADSMEEILEWKKSMAGKDVNFSIDMPDEAGRRQVVLDLKKSEAKTILGYEPDEEEWLEEVTCQECQDSGEKVIFPSGVVSGSNFNIVFCSCETGRKMAEEQSDILSKYTP